MPRPILFLFKLLHLLEAIEEIFKYLCIASDTLHLALEFLALAVLLQQELPFGGIAYCEYLLLLGLGLAAKHLDLFLLDHDEDALLDVADALTGLLPQIGILYHVVQFGVHLEVTGEQVPRKGLPGRMLSVLIRVEVLFKLQELIIEVACGYFLSRLGRAH